jgi:hypothetical protein
VAFNRIVDGTCLDLESGSLSVSELVLCGVSLKTFDPVAVIMIDHVVIMMLLRCFFRTWQDWVAGRIEHIDGSVRLGASAGRAGLLS